MGTQCVARVLGACVLLAASPGVAAAQGVPAADTVGVATAARRFASPVDSVEWEAARATAARARGFRVVVSLLDRRLWAIAGGDTLLAAPIAVGSDSVLAYQGRRWRFRTPRARRTVVRKDSLPVWVPPDWHYYEAARQRGLVVRPLPADRPVPLADGSRLVVRGGRAGIVGADSAFVPLPADEEIIFDGALFIPPIGTENRRIPGELGRYRLDLGDGYSLHGTPHRESIGAAATHGCIRLRDEDVARLYRLVPVGTAVYVY